MVSMPSTQPTPDPLFSIDVIVNNSHEMNGLLDQALDRLIPRALQYQHGILVTQISPNSYTVEISEIVPCGVVQEKRMNLENP